jgi:hypothetical protein
LAHAELVLFNVQSDSTTTIHDELRVCKTVTRSYNSNACATSPETNTSSNTRWKNIAQAFSLEYALAVQFS